MEYADKKITCEKCNLDFVFPCGEQKFFSEKGFLEPKKCPKCRGKESVTRPNENTFSVQCPECKKDFNVTFQSKNKEIICYDCFSKK